MLKSKFLSPFLTPLALATVITVGDFSLGGFVSQFPNSGMPSARYAQAAPKMTPAQQIEAVTKNKGQIGGGDQLRRFFYGDLLPLGVQPGGAGMVVNLYNKANDVTFSYCATYDVVVAVKKGRVTMFPPNEVK